MMMLLLSNFPSIYIISGGGFSNLNFTLGHYDTMHYITNNYFLTSSLATLSN